MKTLKPKWMSNLAQELEDGLRKDIFYCPGDWGEQNDPLEAELDAFEESVHKAIKALRYMAGEKPVVWKTPEPEFSRENGYIPIEELSKSYGGEE